MARAIYVEKAIEIIEEKQKELCPVGRYGRNYVYGSDREKYDAWEEIIDALDNLPTLTPPNEWASVEDAMPPELKMVLVYCGGLYDVAGWVKNEDGEVCWTCKTAPDFWRQIPEME